MKSYAHTGLRGPVALQRTLSRGGARTVAMRLRCAGSR